jgi:DNA-binding SARP family transcriptional activator
VILEIRLLGPVEARVGGRPLALLGAKQRALLAMLALDANRVVSLERLVDGLWGDRPPASAAKNLQLYVSQLRRLLSGEGGDAAIATRGRGYELQVESDAVDVARFERLLAEAERAQEAGASASAARAALELWRGAPLADVAGEPFAASEVRRLDELRLSALELAIEQDLAAGRHLAAIGELDSLLAQRPWRERLHGLRMLALCRCGRQAEALEAYRDARRALTERLGIEPGRELRELQAAILRQDPGLGPRPALPAGTVTFLVAEVERSTRLLAELDATGYADALEQARRLVRECIGRHGGVEVGARGDSFFVAFRSAREAAAMASRVQEALALGTLRLRIGLHTGEARQTAGEYVGLDVHLAARICAAAHAGQVLLSQATRDLVDVETRDLGLHRLEELDSPERLYQLGDRQFPPLRTLSLFGRAPPPLLGRAEELAMATAALAEHGCAVVGAAGVGKSRLAAEAARLAAGGATVERVIATESARALPFGAFSHLLPADPAAAASPIPAAIGALRERSPARAAIVLVDDAHLLDPASAALVLALASTGAARPLLTVRSGVPVPDALVALWKDTGLLRLDLQPLARDEVAELVDTFLGGPADGAVHRRAFELSEGNPLYVREFLADAGRSGALARAEGLWRLSGERPRLERLRELIAARTGDLTLAARRGLELLALCSPLALAELRDLAGSDAIEELERAGLAVVAGAGGDEAVALAHPLHGEVVRDELAAEAGRRLGRELAATLAARPDLAPLDLVRAATWKLEAGEPDPELCLRACRSALLNVAGVPGTGWGGADPELALRLADAAGPGLEPALYVARALMVLDRFAEVEERLAPLEREAAGAGPELAGAYLRTRALSLRWRGAGPKALELIERAAGWEDGPDWAALRASLRGWILFYDGRPGRAVAELEPLAGTPGLAPAARLDLLVALVTALDRLGLTDRCEALEPEIEALAGELDRAGIETGWARYAVASQARVDAARGLPAVAERLATGIERAEGRGDEALAGGLGWAAGRLELIRGHTADAARLLERAAGGLAVGDPKTALGLCLADLARAHAARGDAAAAAAALARAEAAGGERPAFRRLALELGGARAWVEVARGRPAAGREQLLALADAAGEDLTIQVDAAYAALRLGAPPRACAERLAPLAERMQSDLASACVAHARARAQDDGRAQLEAARRFAELEVDILCAEAAAGAARALRLEGQQASAREAAALAARHAGRCQGARTPAMAQAEDLVGLT